MAVVTVNYSASSNWDGELCASNGSGATSLQFFHSQGEHQTGYIDVMDNDLLVVSASNSATPHLLTGGSGIYLVFNTSVGFGSNYPYVCIYKVTQSTTVNFT